MVPSLDENAWEDVNVRRTLRASPEEFQSRINIYIYVYIESRQ